MRKWKALVGERKRVGELGQLSWADYGIYLVQIPQQEKKEKTFLITSFLSQGEIIFHMANHISFQLQNTNIYSDDTLKKWEMPFGKLARRYAPK